MMSPIDIVCLPIIDWRFRFQRPQQLATRFARHGHRVFYLSTRFRRLFGPTYKARRMAENVEEVSLRGPKRHVYTDLLDDTALERLFAGVDQLRRERRIESAVVMVQLPFWTPLAERLRERFGWRIVYDCMDHHAGFSSNATPMVAEEERLLAGADLVLASSQGLLAFCRERTEHVLLLPNACDYEHFSRVKPRPGKERPVIGYYGAIADWFDSNLVSELARHRTDWDFVFIGSTWSGDVRHLERLPNVRLTGEQPYASLPRWLDGMDVLMLPFKRQPLTEATNPVKAYEILAAGRPLVSVPLPEMAALAPLVRLASTVHEFEHEIDAALREDDPAQIERRRAFARHNTWEARYQRLWEALA